MPPKLQLLAVVAFAVAMLFLENQIQKLEESRSKLGEEPSRYGMSGVEGAGWRGTATGAAGVHLTWWSGFGAERFQGELRLGASRAQAPRIG